MAEDLRRLFEQGGDDTPVLTRRVAWGLAGTVTKNSTWQTIVTWLQGVLNFLKPSNNLSDVTDAATALSNLGGIGAGALNGYALKSNVLELNNTVEFTPDNPYEPVPKVYNDSFHIQGSGTGAFHQDGAIDADITVRKHGSIVTVTGWFVSDDNDGTEAAPITVSTILNVGIPLPTHDIFISAVSGDNQCRLIMRGVYLLLTSSASINSKYYYNFTYIV